MFDNMVTGQDCSCADTTEPSNLTSLHSDDVTSAVNSDVVNEVCTKMIEKENDVEGPKDTDCKCSTPIATYCVAATAETPKSATPAKPNRQRENSRDPPDVATQLSFTPCLCRSHKINGYVLPMKLKKEKSQSRPFWGRFNWKRQRNGYFSNDKMYEIKLKQIQCPHYAQVPLKGMPKQHLETTQPPHEPFQPFAAYEMSDIGGIPSKSTKYNAGKLKPLKYPAKTKLKKEEVTEKIEIYYFDHGSSAYYRTTDCHPVLATDKCAEKTDQAATRFWAEIFGTIHIGIAFVTAFILQLFRFILYSVIRPLTVGILQLVADYFVKPLLSILFNAIVQPILILLYNIATSFRDLCEPIAEAIGLFLREIANLCAAIRLVEVKHVHTSATTACT
ncbi:uncharacterized protein LOC114941328 [Nylanderia fulva]|uniref:uncharacterized protein LOC114941328 n=1 Tax=Nylanderia fulva TaxID=613905 RepID=UPI0010FB7F63|nr:uncharacterized protein LOC114941328 [Nylanderia fulva]